LNPPNHDSQVDLTPMNRTKFNQHANFNPDSSSEPYQRWDENGNAVGWTGDPNLMFAPKPSRAVGYMSPTPSERRNLGSPQGERSDRPSEELGYQYPMTEVGRDGRVVLRQESDDSASSEAEHQPQGAEYRVEVRRIADSPPFDQYGVPRQTNLYSQQPPQLPSMQLTQSDPSPSRSPAQNFSRSMATSASVPGSSPAMQYQYDSPRQYQPPPLPSMSPNAQSTSIAGHYQPHQQYGGYNPGEPVEERRGYSPSLPSYHSDVNPR
jgi:hypothetical protein